MSVLVVRHVVISQFYYNTNGYLILLIRLNVLSGPILAISNFIQYIFLFNMNDLNLTEARKKYRVKPSGRHLLLQSTNA